MNTFLLSCMRTLPAETAHNLALKGLKHGFVPRQVLPSHPVKVGEMLLRNPVGMAAGFDKNGEAVSALFDQGFGFVECGTVTPRPQGGNPKPRLFRLPEDGAIINRMGFNNQGVAALRLNLVKQENAIARHRAKGAILGINIGKNKDSEDAIHDYLTMFKDVYDLADYVTLNISSPNTPGLRDLQSAKALTTLLDAVCEARERLPKQVPLWLKLAPDLGDAACADIAATVARFPVDALIISNTTLARPARLGNSYSSEAGGLSGKPLMALSTERLRFFKGATDIPLIGVGGIASGADAQEKIAAGAVAIQLYTALVYQGFGLIRNILNSFDTSAHL